MNEYILTDAPDELFHVTNFACDISARESAVVSWDWPRSPEVKLMLIFVCDEESTLEELIASGHTHEVVSRGLKNSFTVPLTGRQKVIAAPAGFGEGRTVLVYRRELQTGWLYKRIPVHTQIIEKPLTMGKFKQVYLRISVNEKEHTHTLATVLKYTIDGVSYPLDEKVMAGAAFFYVEKEKNVRVVIHEDHAHLYDIVLART